ncbi:MAG: transcriptional regulator [Candidatus Thiothrix sulfatifontis]|nr:MAG: transcriptional regulator [Candidatus Thiothrix sulfatifontis]
MSLTKHQAALRSRRDQAEIQKERFVQGLSLCHGKSSCQEPCAQRVNATTVASWQRSPAALQSQPIATPRDDEHSILATWEASLLRQAVSPELDKLNRLVQEDTFVAAIADPNGKLLWTAEHPSLRPFTETINFIPGGQWAESISGTNGVGLALSLCRPCTVFATEHYWPACHDIVCYAAPIIHPQSGQLLGVLDLTTHWQRHVPFAESVVAHIANDIARRLPIYLPRADLEIHALGQAKVLFQGQCLHLNQRQLEILCILALNPQGITLETLYQALCPHAHTHPATIKTILTSLRHLLKGEISSHPYRFGMSVWADFVELSQVLQQNNRIADALKLYHGSLLPNSTAPALEEARNHLEAGMEALLYRCQDAQTLLDHANNLLCNPLVRERLLELLAC